MPDPDPRAEFAAMTAALIEDFRAHGGKVSSGPYKDRDVLLLTTTGAKSGQLRLAPLVYTRDGDRFVMVASKGGSLRATRLMAFAGRTAAARRDGRLPERAGAAATRAGRRGGLTS